VIIESGIIVFVGLVFLFIKLPKALQRTLVKHELSLDLAMMIMAYTLHWGTFTGVMAAAVAGLLTSAFTALMSVRLVKVPEAGGWMNYLSERFGFKVRVRYHVQEA